MNVISRSLAAVAAVFFAAGPLAAQRGPEPPVKPQDPGEAAEAGRDPRKREKPTMAKYGLVRLVNVVDVAEGDTLHSDKVGVPEPAKAEVPKGSWGTGYFLPGTHKFDLSHEGCEPVRAEIKVEKGKVYVLVAGMVEQFERDREGRFKLDKDGEKILLRQLVAVPIESPAKGHALTLIYLSTRKNAGLSLKVNKNEVFLPSGGQPKRFTIKPTEGNEYVAIKIGDQLLEDFYFDSPADHVVVFWDQAGGKGVKAKEIVSQAVDPN